MTTDAIRTRLYNKKLLDYLTLRTKFMDYLVSEFRQLHGDAYSIDGVLASVAITVAPAATANKVDIAAAVPCKGVSGSGKRFNFTAGDARLQGIWIPPDVGVVYHVGLEQNDVEDGIEVNPRTGEYEYSQYKEMLGRVGNPTSVTDNGDGTLTINVNGLCESGKSYAGRSIRVWLTSRADGGIGPLSASSAVAFQDLTIAYAAPNNTITVPNLLGQTVASTTVANYKVMLNGPTVKRQGAEDLRNTPGCLFLAAVTSVALASMIVSCDTTDQNIISQSLAQMGAAITANQNAINLNYGGGGAWADGTTNPATSVEAQLDKIISDLSPSTGTAKIGGAAVGGDLAAGTLAGQIATIANDWGKLARTNTWSGAQEFGGGLYFTLTQTMQLDVHGSYGSFGTHAPGYEQSTAASEIVDVPILLPIGAVIWGYSFQSFGNGADNLDHKLVKITNVGEVDIGAITISAPPATWQTKFNNFVGEPVASGTRYVLRFTAHGSGQRVGWPTVDWTYPKP